MTTVTHPLQALLTALFNRLITSGDIWETRVTEVVQPKWVKPYVQMYLVSGGEDNFLVAQDASFQLGIKVIAETQAQSFQLAARLSELLNDQGVQDRPTTALDGGTYWEICTSTQGRLLHQVESFSDAVPIYHDGAVYEFVLGRK